MTCNRRSGRPSVDRSALPGMVHASLSFLRRFWLTGEMELLSAEGERRCSFYCCHRCYWQGEVNILKLSRFVLRTGTIDSVAGSGQLGVSRQQIPPGVTVRICTICGSEKSTTAERKSRPFCTREYLCL